MNLDEWLRFSPEFDWCMLEKLCCICEKIVPLCNLYKAHLKEFNSQCVKWSPAKRECCITNLKIFSFYIVALCIPCYGNAPEFDKICTYLLDIFKENKASIAEHMSIGFKILNKGN